MAADQREKDSKTTTPMGLERDPPQAAPLGKIVAVASLSAGIQFGWAVQLSLLTPYVQLLGIPHKWASLIWLGGPISGILVPPIVGYHSDRCTNRFGRRRPFIVAGAGMVAIAVFLIGYAADIGNAMGDSLKKTPKTRAVAIFAVGFWILDVASNMLQVTCRALLADLSGDSARKTRLANTLFSFFMAVGNILGYVASSYPHLHKAFPFTSTNACDLYCSNLKSGFFFFIMRLLALTVTVSIYVKEERWTPEPSDGDKGGSSKVPFFGEILGALKDLKRPMLMLLATTALNWIAWFPFLLFDTDWMGREVYGGDSAGDQAAKRVYNAGVRAGSLGLMINSVALGIMSLGIEWVARMMGSVKRLWGIVNFILAGCLAMTVLITKLAEAGRSGSPHSPLSPGVKAGALSVFGVLGIPLAVTYSIPFALASIFSRASGAGQGLSQGVLNLAIVIPQMIVSLGEGYFDDLFGGSNLPAFVLGAVFAAASGVLAMTVLPSPPVDRITVAPGFHCDGSP